GQPWLPGFGRRHALVMNRGEARGTIRDDLQPMVGGAGEAEPQRGKQIVVGLLRDGLAWQRQAFAPMQEQAAGAQAKAGDPRPDAHAGHRHALSSVSKAIFSSSIAASRPSASSAAPRHSDGQALKRFQRSASSAPFGSRMITETFRRST